MEFFSKQQALERITLGVPMKDEEEEEEGARGTARVHDS
jgi:exonuclease V gamma subunit